MFFSEDIDVPPVVRSVKLTCHEGSVTWYNPIGALRLEVSPTATKGFRLCFIMESGNAAVKLSHERDEPFNVKSPTNRQQYLLSESNLKTIFKGSGASKEHCMSSSEPVILYLEPELSGRLGYQKIFLQYDVIPQSEVKEPSIDGNVYNTYTRVVWGYYSPLKLQGRTRTRSVKETMISF